MIRADHRPAPTIYLNYEILRRPEASGLLRMTSIFTMWRSHPERLPARLDGKAGQDERQVGSRRVPA